MTGDCDDNVMVAMWAPSIFDVRTEWGELSGSCGRPKEKLEPTDIIMSSSHAKKLASFVPKFCLWTE